MPVPEPVLTRVAQEDPNGPPLFELRAEYMVASAGAPSRLCGTIGRLSAAAGDLLLSAVYFLGVGALASLIRSRDPFALKTKGTTRWLVLPSDGGRRSAEPRG